MYTQDSNYKEMAAKVKELGLTVESTKKVDLIEALNAHAAEVSANETRGRKVNPNSARQKRLAEMEAKRAAGELRRGRPSDPNSAWNQKQAALAEKRAAGTLSLGRPVDPTSARQERLAKVGTVKRGRPVGSGKKVETETPIETTAE